jgi:hypothetical protein
MGMFDTINFEKPIPCPECGAKISSLQTKEFENFMGNYYVGSLLRGSSVLNGILKEEIWCDACFEAKRESRHPIYLVIWNSILAGIETSEEAANQRLASVDRLDLVGWLDEAQRSVATWQKHFFGLLGDLEKWQDHLERQANPQDDDQANRWAGIFKLPDEILQAKDPLKALLTQHREEAKQGKHAGGLW